jgi:hypothetical protein
MLGDGVISLVLSVGGARTYRLAPAARERLVNAVAGHGDHHLRGVLSRHDLLTDG